MSVRINTNVDALVAQQHLSQVGLDFSSAVAKLSSGLRINSAADDAAGLAISEKLTSQVNGFDQGSRNAQDAISMVQTGESALGTTHTILQRMRELAVQASNDSYTSSDRSNIQAEINQLIQEVDRISQQTDFNTKKLLDGSAGAAQVSGGGPDIKGIAVQGSVGFNGTYGTVSASGTGVGAATTFQAVRGSATASNTLLTKGSTMSVTAGNGTTYTFTVDNVNAKTMTVTGNTSGTGAGYSTTVTGNGAGGVVDVQDFMNAVNNITGGPLNAFQDAGNQVYVNDVIGGIQSTANTAGPAALNITAAGAANSFGLGLLNLNAAGGQGTVTRPDATSAANGFAIGTATVMSLTAAATRSSVESLSGPSGSYFTQTSSITIQGGLGNQTFTTQAGESLETLFQQVNGSGIGVTMAIDQTSGQVLIYNNNYGLKSAANLTGVNQVAVSNATGDFAGGVTPITGGLNMGFDSAFTAGSVDQNLKFLQNAGVDVAAVNAVVTFLDPGHI
ncbi:MAG TPA: hypothetical protein VFS62_00915, partial [Chloroflexota bacterium]|nr:hypothetical protein [Chloroflexota bacterium]